MQARDAENQRNETGDSIDTSIFNSLGNGQLELLTLAFSFLNFADQVSASLVCKQWQTVMQNHLITGTDEDFKFYMSIRFLNSRLETSLRMKLESCRKSVLEEAIKKRNFFRIIESESDNKDDVLQLITLELDHIRKYGSSKFIYFIAECTLKNNKLTISSCDRILDDQGIVQVFTFSSPIACDVRGVEPYYLEHQYQERTPEMEAAYNLVKIEFNKWMETFNNRKQAQLNTPAAPVNFGQSSLTTFAKLKPRPQHHARVVEQKQSVGSLYCTLS